MRISANARAPKGAPSRADCAAPEDSPKLPATEGYLGCAKVQVDHRACKRSVTNPICRIEPCRTPVVLGAGMLRSAHRYG